MTTALKRLALASMQAVIMRQSSQAFPEIFRSQTGCERCSSALEQR